MGYKGVNLTPGVLARIHQELARSGVLAGPVLPQITEQMLTRARQQCAVCAGGLVTAQTIAHHNLRAAELGERSYPCTRGRD